MLSLQGTELLAQTGFKNTGTSWLQAQLDPGQTIGPGIGPSFSFFLNSASLRLVPFSVKNSHQDRAGCDLHLCPWWLPTSVGLMGEWKQTAGLSHFWATKLFKGMGGRPAEVHQTRQAASF